MKRSSKPFQAFTLLLKGLLCTVLLFATNAKGQLSGTYTIGASASSYSTISAAVKDLTTNGVSGAVAFSVAAGTYNEQVSIGKITGVSSSNTITFNGAGQGKSIISNSGNYVIEVSSVSYINFNGFTVQTTNTSGYGIEEISTSYCSVANTNIMAYKGAASGGAAIYTYNANYLTINNCYIFGGYYGTYINGSNTTSASPLGNMVFSNNKIVEFQEYALFISNGGGYSVVNNLYNSNIIDSSYNSGASGVFSEEETGATYSNNKVLAALVNSFYLTEPNLYSSSTPFQVYNSFITNYTFGVYLTMGGSATNVLVAYNTFFTDSAMTPEGCIYVTTSTAKSVSIEDNILEQLFANNSGTNALLILNGAATDYNMVDGNDLYCPGQNYAYLFGTTYYSFASYQQAASAFGWEASAKNIKPVYINPPFDLHLDQNVLDPLGINIGINTDIDGNPRCKLFPTAGANESSYQKGKPTAKFFMPSTIYPGSPVEIAQTATAGEPYIYSWYLNGVLISDSITLATNKFVVGVDSLRLVVTSCGGSSTYQAIDTVKAPKSVPVVDFVSNNNLVQTGQTVFFEDVSSNGPTSWVWEITPVLSGGGSNAYIYVNSDSTSQNPQVQFTAKGLYKVCLTASNAIGSGTQNCKTNFITVYQAYNIGSQSTVSDSTGYLYDDGGPNAPYVSNGGTNSILINPCADTVYLTFSMFDLYCGNAYLKIFEGKDNTGTLLGSCPQGFTGGPTYSCALNCMPNITKPDTFKAKNFMYIQMSDGANSNAAGFAAHWWSKLKTDASNPKPSFTSSESGDSVCIGHRIVFTNTTKIDPNDPPNFFWSVGGNFASFPCPGNCAITVDSFNVSGQVQVTLIASSCGGTDSATQTVTVYNPPPPNAGFSVDNQNPTLSDYIYFSPDASVCIDNYQWAFAKSSPTDTGSAIYQNGTSSSSSSPVVTFSDTGYYNVTLTVENNLGVLRNIVTKTKFIYVRQPYCVPTVVSLTPDIGISKVMFNQITNFTQPGSAQYSSFVNTPSLSASVQLGLTYPITVQRDSPAYNAIIRAVYIDWNQDGIFSASERVAVDSNSTSVKWAQNIKVPTSATIGATVMRIAVDVASEASSPCGPNKFGEFQDYRIYVQPYQTLPVITLKGSDTVHLELGYTYVEPGYSASSALYGNITSLVKVTSSKLGIPFPGGVLYAYNVTDSANLQALTKYRVVLYVKDTIPPQLIVAGPDTSKFEILTPVAYPKVVSTFDLVTKILHPVIDTSQVKNDSLGIYPVYYTLTDSAGNKTTVIRYIDIVDTVAPVLVLKGKASDTIAANSPYKDSGVVVIDNYYRIGLLDSLVKTSFSPTLNVNALGTYTETYSLTDPSGNKARPITRQIVIVDKTPPVITLVGPATDSVEVYTAYTDPGATVTDNIDKPNQIVVTRLGTFFALYPSGIPDSLGTFTIVYVARDLAGNVSSLTRYVKVQDRIAPVVNLIGGQAVTICRWRTYIDSGYTVSDNYDSVKDIKIDTIGSFLTNGRTSVEGAYYLAYVATDRSGNKGYSPYRAITVLSEGYSQCASGIVPGLNPDKYVSVYPNPGPGLFFVNMNFPPYNNANGAQTASITVTNILGKGIAISNAIALNENIFRVDLSNQPSGVYFLNIVAGNQRVVKRIEIAK